MSRFRIFDIWTSWIFRYPYKTKPTFLHFHFRDFSRGWLQMRDRNHSHSQVPSIGLLFPGTLVIPISNRKRFSTKKFNPFSTMVQRSQNFYFRIRLIRRGYAGYRDTPPLSCPASIHLEQYSSI